MIITLIMTSLAFYWLLLETQYLTVNLLIIDYDIPDYELEFDNSDYEYLDDYQKQHDDMLNEIIVQQADKLDYELGYQEYIRQATKRVKPANAGGSQWLREYNRGRTREMLDNRRTMAQVAYRG